MSGMVCIHNAGVTSCLSMRLHEAVEHFENYLNWPDYIDSSQQFQWYKDLNQQNVADIILDKYEPKTLPYVGFKEDWQYRWYDQIGLPECAVMAQGLTPLSKGIMHITKDMLFKLGNRTAILYRGNDKIQEVGRANYDTIIQMAKESESTSFLLQTDEQDFYDYFCEHFSDVVSFETIPRIPRTNTSYVMPPKGMRVNFACNFLAALYTISKANKLILTTGNTGLWTMLFRGNHDNVWQYNGKYDQYCKL